MIQTLLNILILSGISVFVPILIISPFYFFNIKVKKSNRVSLYAFATGLIIILSTVGFIGEAIEGLLHSEKTGLSNTNQIIATVGIVASGVLIGAGIVFFIRWLVLRSKTELHANCELHDHSEHIFNVNDIDNKKAKWVSLILLLSHRIIDGISLGFLGFESNGVGNFHDWGQIIIFVLHLIPMTLVIYLIQLDISHNKHKSFLYSFLMLVLLIPFIFVGGFLGKGIESIWWLMPLLFTISGSILLVMTIIELIPEFIDNRNMNPKQWYISLLSLIVGVLIAIIFSCIHTH